MNDKEMHEAFEAFLAARRNPIEPKPGFTENVMASIAAWERSRAALPAEKKIRSRSMTERLRRYLFDSFAGRSVAAFALLALVCVPLSLRYLREAGSDRQASDSTRIKGGAFRLGFLLKRGNRIEPAVPGGWFRPGDRLQAVYSSPASGHLRLYSLSDGGEIACISCQADSEGLPAGQGKSLPYALELDSSRGDEAMIALFTAAPLATDSSAHALSAAWERSGHDFAKLGAQLKSALPAATSVSVFPIRKHSGEKKI